jgi:outer membrane cobalamin receptor
LRLGSTAGTIDVVKRLKFHVGRTAPLVRQDVIALMLCLALWAAGPATAQTAPPAPRATATVVVTATLAPLPVDESGRTVMALLREDLDLFGVRSLIDALRMIPGIDARARGPHDVQTDFSIRGATFGQSLVLFDGFRLNDSQSGHHNGEMPIPVVALDRVEVAAGPASAAHGADALGGTINLVPRQDAHMAAEIEAGQHGYLSTQAAVSGRWLPDRWSLSGWGSRSAGFTFDRDFAQGGVAVRAPLQPSVIVDARHQRRAFGANGFYGASPSKEWTDQTLLTAAWRRSAGTWLTQVRGLYRRHGDHFRWDINRPGFAENRHGTDAVEATGTLERHFGGGGRVTAGGGGGGDWIASSNLGDHQYGRAFAFAEAHLPVHDRVSAQAGIRLDSYSTFGRAWTPSVAVSARVAEGWRLRGSASRAFRIPTFTELYYRDPAHQASGALVPEHGWAIDAGLDFRRGEWTAAFSPFFRRDSNVIDWVRARPTDLWQTTNVRDVATRGVELALARRSRAAMVRAHYAYLDVDAPQLAQLSKYVLEYARHAVGMSVSAPLPGLFRGSVQVDYRHRASAEAYSLVTARISRRIGGADLFVSGTNLLNVSYVEVPGVAMPGRWLTLGVSLR